MPGLTDAVRDRLRTILKIRKLRALPRPGPKPGVGAKIFKGDVRMMVQAGMSHELWRWLQEQGWREVQFKPDRRRYRDVPSAWVTRLIDSAPDERAAVLDAAIAHAADRSRQRTLTADTAPPAAPPSE